MTLSHLLRLAHLQCGAGGASGNWNVVNTVEVVVCFGVRVRVRAQHSELINNSTPFFPALYTRIQCVHQYLP